MYFGHFIIFLRKVYMEPIVFHFQVIEVWTNHYYFFMLSNYLKKNTVF